jgi:hypothetical protein
LIASINISDKGGEAMDHRQAFTDPAGRVSQQKPIGGDAMRKFVWSTIDASNRYNGFLIIEFTDEEDYEEFWSLPSGVEKSVFLSEKLEGKRVFIPDAMGGYELEFPPYFDEYGRKNLFWYNNVFEDFEEAYERLMEEWVKALREYYDDEEALLEEAKIRTEEELSKLSIVRI